MSKNLYTRNDDNSIGLPSLLDFGLTPLQEKIFVTLMGTGRSFYD